VDPVPDPVLLRKSGSAVIRTRDLWICSHQIVKKKYIWNSGYEPPEGVLRRLCCLSASRFLISCLAYSFTLKIEAKCSSETSIYVYHTVGVALQKTTLFIVTVIGTSSPKSFLTSSRNINCRNIVSVAMYCIHSEELISNRN
jgi:hypothetical protein